MRGKVPPMTLEEKQREHLKATIQWARKLRAELQPIVDAHGDKVHFWPSSSGVTMVAYREVDRVACCGGGR